MCVDEPVCCVVPCHSMCTLFPFDFLDMMIRVAGDRQQKEPRSLSRCVRVGPVTRVRPQETSLRKNTGPAAISKGEEKEEKKEEPKSHTMSRSLLACPLCSLFAFSFLFVRCPVFLLDYSPSHTQLLPSQPNPTQPNPIRHLPPFSSKALLGHDAVKLLEADLPVLVLVGPVDHLLQLRLCCEHPIGRCGV